jgi:hypothetical protein
MLHEEQSFPPKKDGKEALHHEITMFISYAYHHSHTHIVSDIYISTMVDKNLNYVDMTSCRSPKEWCLAVLITMRIEQLASVNGVSNMRALTLSLLQTRDGSFLNISIILFIFFPVSALRNNSCSIVTPTKPATVT